MTDAATTYGALARALVPPGGDPTAFAALGLPEPEEDALAAEHAVLFGRVGPAVVSPYEGVRHDVAPHALLDTYARGGRAVDPGFRDRPDHVSVELAFLEHLVLEEEEASRRGDAEAARGAGDRARAFFAEHVGRWLPDFLEALALVDGFPIHRSLARAALPFLRREVAGMDLPTPSAPRRNPALPEARCRECGRPLGFPVPDLDDSRPTLSPTCLRCRLRADLRRSTT